MWQNLSASSAEVPGVTCGSKTLNSHCIVCFYEDVENEPWKCEGDGCKRAVEARRMEVETFMRITGNFSSSGGSPPIASQSTEQGHPAAASSYQVSHPIQSSEVQELQEEVAKLKGKVQDMVAVEKGKEECPFQAQANLHRLHLVL